jgi:plastocyanin
VTVIPRWLGALAGAALLAVPAAPLAAPKTYQIVIQQMKFAPAPSGLKVGDTIEWVNNDIFLHSATARDKSFDVELRPKAHVRLVLAKAGTVDFACRYHPGMTGRLVVGKQAR